MSVNLQSACSRVLNIGGIQKMRTRAKSSIYKCERSFLIDNYAAISRWLVKNQYGYSCHMVGYPSRFEMCFVCLFLNYKLMVKHEGYNHECKITK